MGPPQKPADLRARKNATPGMTMLPAAGRRGRTPAWPLIADVVMTTRHDLAGAKVQYLELELLDAEDVTKQRAIERRLDVAREQLAILTAQLAAQRDLEKRLWRTLWATPQAVQWDKLGWTREVAQYVRHKVLGELGVLDDAKEARAWSDRLGLTPKAMQGLRWEVTSDEVAEKRATRTPPAPAPVPTAAKTDPRNALRAVQ